MKAQSFLVYLLLAGALFLGSLLISLAQTAVQSHPLSEIEMPADTNLDMGGYNITHAGSIEIGNGNSYLNPAIAIKSDKSRWLNISTNVIKFYSGTSTSTEAWLHIAADKAVSIDDSALNPKLVVNISDNYVRINGKLGINRDPNWSLDVSGSIRTNSNLDVYGDAHISGKVGIGTSSPETALDVNGIIKGNYGGGLTAGGAGVTKYYFVGSLPYSSASVYQKLYVAVWGGGWDYSCSGIDEYVISSRSGKVIYRTRTKGGGVCKYSLKVYDTGSGYDFYIAIEGQDYPNLLIRAFKLDSPDRWVEQRIYEKTPTGTDDTANWEIRSIIYSDASANVHFGKDLYLEKASPTIYVRQSLNIRLDKNTEGDYKLNIQKNDGTTVAYIAETGAVVAPALYDINNLAYYINPYGTSNVRRINAEAGIRPSPSTVPSITLSDTTNHGPEVYKYTGTINGVSCDSTTRGVIMVAHITNSETGAQDALCFCTLEGSNTYYWTCLQI